MSVRISMSKTSSDGNECNIDILVDITETDELIRVIKEIINILPLKEVIHFEEEKNNTKETPVNENNEKSG